MKPEHISQDLYDRIINYNREQSKNREAAEDFMRFLDALPPGQAKNLMKDPTLAEILQKYGITGE